MSRRLRTFGAAALAMIVCLGGLAGCGGPQEPVVLGAFPLDDLDGLLCAGEGVDIDATRSVDGAGSLHFYTEGKALHKLYEIPVKDFGGDTVVLRAHLMSEVLFRGAFLDLWVFPRDGESRSTRHHCDGISRTSDWQDFEFHIPLLDGEQPEKLRVSIYIFGPGHVWIDDLEVLSARAVELDGMED